MQIAAGGPLQLTPEEQKYLEWSKMTPKQKREYRTNRVKTYLQSGPNITNFWEAFQTYIGNRDPENPHLNIGIINAPGRATPQQVVQRAQKVKQVVKKAKSISERAAKISDKIWDKHYLRLVNKGETKRAQIVRDLHFKAKTPDNKITEELYHGTNSDPWNIFDINYFGKKDGGFYGKGLYLTKYPNMTKFYGKNRMNFFVYSKNPLKANYDPVVDIKASPEYKASYYFNRPEEPIPIKNKELFSKILNNKDGVSINNESEVVIPSGFQLKSSSAIVYDNNGNIIPISQRDNFLINDIRYKQGGKMNVLEFLKNGSGIHIKEKNKGSFTRWCGGNVTEECIRRGKASSNPKIRKKATFADNARHFKHSLGGQIVKEFKIRQKFQQGGSVDWGSIASDILNQGIQTAFQNEQITALNKTNNADLDKKYSQMLQSLQELSNEKQKEYLMNWVNNFRNGYTLEHLSPVTMKHFGQNQIGQQVGNAKDEISKQKKANDDAATSQKAANYAQLFGTVANTALNAFGQYMANKQKNTPTVQQTPTIQQTPTYNTPQIYTGTNGSINTNYSNLYTGSNGSLRFD